MATQSAYFAITDDITEGEFIIRLDDAAKIEHARAVLGGVAGLEPHVMGTIVKETAPYNPNWSYHFDPATIVFFEIAIEVCDANIGYVEENLADAGGAFLPKNHWCPWQSRLVREVEYTA